MKEFSASRATTVPTLHALYTLFAYRSLKAYQDGEFIGSRIGGKIVIIFIYCTLYLNIGSKYSTQVGEVTADTQIPFSLLSMLGSFCIVPLMDAGAYIPSIALEKPTFVRERNDGLYRPIAYLIFQII